MWEDKYKSSCLRRIYGRKLFQFKDPVLLKLDYKENQNFDYEKFNEMKLDFEISVNKSKNNQAFVTLSLVIGEDANNPFYLSISMGSEFSWEDEKEDDLISELLNINAPALLTGYMRPIISLITSSSRFPTFNLPFLDFTQQYKEIKSKSTEKSPQTISPRGFNLLHLLFKLRMQSFYKILSGNPVLFITPLP